MELQANEFLKNKQWDEAIELYTKLLHAKGTTKQQVVAYLLARSECFLELAQHEAVIGDCRRVIRLLAGKKGDDNEYRAHRSLVHSLFSLKRFGEAELAVKEWAAVSQSKNGEVARILEDLYTNFTKDSSKLNMTAETKNETRLQKVGAGVDEMPVCTYCNITFKDRVELRGHCQTESHQRMIMSDEGRDWHCRAPPRGYTSDTYCLCESFLETGACRYGAQCIEAHGSDELAEWKERFAYRLMKLQRAYDKELFGKSYIEELLEQWIHSPNPELIMKEHLDYVACTCSSSLVTIISSKHTAHDWEFTLSTDAMLHGVALLQDTHRNHFELVALSWTDATHNKTHAPLNNTQEWINRTDDLPANRVYKITIRFKTEIYGTFRQSIVFDFGNKPVLVKHFCVDVMPVMDIEKLNEIKKDMIMSNSDRWSCSNSNIIAFVSNIQLGCGNAESEWAKSLNNMYPTPRSETFILSQTTVTEKKLTKYNYKARMHELLYVEEMARYEQISMYNLKAQLTIARSYVLAPNSNASSTAKYSASGELFAVIKLGRELSEDTSAGRLILNNCTTILVAADEENPHPTVYECLIEDKGKKVIYLRLSARMVADLRLAVDKEFSAQIQFQLNRLPYCEWHYAVDKIQDYGLIYPDITVEPSIPWSPQKQWPDGLDGRLNLKQREAIIAITTPLYVPLPPILIIGPFGTGKTFTLAQAIKNLLVVPGNRILICTHSNSAADLYIKDYLDPWVNEGKTEATPLRIYYHKRWVSTVHETVQKYCLIDSNGSSRSFRVPTIDDLKKHRIIVVTLSISMYLATIGLPKGYFTHILLDEAAQAMECEAIMPLALADECTRIVLAGDHMQLSPEIFSQFAKERNLHVSLLERLYDHYPPTFPCKILLSENYRAHEAIIDFTSESFYDQKLVACGKQPRHDIYYPLTFFTTRGEDVQDQNSTAFYNNSEVYEIVERVMDLKRLWPKNWGAFNEQSIGIMTPYSDQVFRIRSELRKQRMYGISVERVLNVQGKQFRAIFLSTVRTRRTCQGNKNQIEYGFLSNSKLLNTAVTRAQSLVAVVGDPVALCSVGRCSKVWERFLQICDANKSLFGITWSQLRSQLDGVELKKSYTLNPLAPEFVPKKYLMEAYIINSRVVPPAVNNWNVPPMIRYNHPGYVPVMYQIQPRVPFGNWVYQMRPNPVLSLPKVPNMYLGSAPNLVPNVALPPNVIPNLALTNPMQNFMGSPLLQNAMIPNIREKPIIQSIHPVIEASIPLPVKQENPETAEKHDEKNLIQFMSNVHFPELSHNSHCTLHDYINLLPSEMTLAEMITQPYEAQERWFHHLLKTKGVEAAKKFEYLIHTTTKTEPKQSSSKQDLSPCKSYFQGEQHEPSWYNKPANQINMNQPIYFFENISQPRRTETSVSQPLYKRHSARTADVAEKPWQSEVNTQLSNVRLGQTPLDEESGCNGVTYAGILRSPKPNVAGNTPLELINNIKSDNINGGPRLYQYFS